MANRNAHEPDSGHAIGGRDGAISRRGPQPHGWVAGRAREPHNGVGSLTLSDGVAIDLGTPPCRGSRISRLSTLSRISPTPSVLAYHEENKVVKSTSKIGVEVTSPLDVIFKYVSVVFLVALAYIAFLFLFEVKYLLPYDSGFAVVVLWAASMTGGHLLKSVGLPTLLGMLGAGMIVKNCGDLARGLPASWSAAIRAIGLMNILMRGGLEMDFGAVKRLGFAVVRLTVLPGVTEAITSAGLACAIFGMPFFLALAMGFIIAAVSPAVVVGGMFNLQERGYGVEKGIPSLVVAAASFDDVVAISGFSMFIGLAVGTGDALMSALHGPIEICLGVVAGLAAACILSCTKLWDTRWKRTGALILFGVAFSFAFKKGHFAGAGALASLVMAGAVGQMWSKGFGPLSRGPDEELAHEVEHDLCQIWRFGCEPLLFGVIGAALDFGKVEAATVPKALGVLVGGVIVRCTVAFFSTLGAGLTVKERLFIALAWMPKATVQAALGSVPLDMIRQSLTRADDPAKYDEYVQHGVDILTVAVFSILATAPVGLIIIQQLGPCWLEKFEEVTHIFEPRSTELNFAIRMPSNESVGVRIPRAIPQVFTLPPGAVSECSTDVELSQPKGWGDDVARLPSPNFNTCLSAISLA